MADDPACRLLSAEAAPNARSPPVEPVAHKRKEILGRVQKQMPQMVSSPAKAGDPVTTSIEVQPMTRLLLEARLKRGMTSNG